MRYGLSFGPSVAPFFVLVQDHRKHPVRRKTSLVGGAGPHGSSRDIRQCLDTMTRAFRCLLHLRTVNLLRASIVANHRESLLRPRKNNSARSSLRIRLYRHPRRIWEQEHRYFEWSCCPICNYQPVLAYRSIWNNRKGGSQFPRSGRLILDNRILPSVGK